MERQMAIQKIALKQWRTTPAALGWAALGGLMTLVFSVLATMSAQAQSSPWTAIGKYIDEGSLEGTKDDGAQRQKAGGYQYQIWVYKLDDGGYDQGDWYRIDLSVLSSISAYRKGDNVCGWYTDGVNAAFDLETTGGWIEEYAPTTSQSSSEKTYSLGGYVSKGGPAVTATYSFTQTIPDAGIKVKRDGPAETIKWITNLQGCKCNPKNVVPPYACTKGASAVAKSSFKLTPSIVAAVPEGSSLKFKTYLKDFPAGVYLKKFVQNKNEKLKQEYSLTVTCSATSCTFK